MIGDFYPKNVLYTGDFTKIYNICISQYLKSLCVKYENTLKLKLSFLSDDAAKEAVYLLLM